MEVNEILIDVLSLVSRYRARLSIWVDRDVSTASFGQATRSKVLGVAVCSTCVCGLGTFWCAVIGAFRSSLLLRQAAFVPPQVLFVVDQLFCCLIVAVLALGTLILLSLLMLLEWKSYVNAFLDPKGVTFRVVINKLTLNRNISCFHCSFFQITTLC